MKFKHLIFFLFILSPLVGLNQGTIKGKVVSIKDGDTIGVLIDNKVTKVRLFGVDCPELHQDFGHKAKQFTSTASFEKEVKVKVHGKDHFGRMLGEVILPNGKNLNHELVKAGMAWHFKKYSKSIVLKELELHAKQQKLGLWSHPNPVPPWQFRQDQKKNRQKK